MGVGLGGGQCGEHDGQMGLDRFAGVVEHGSDGEVGLSHAEGLFHLTRATGVCHLDRREWRSEGRRFRAEWGVLPGVRGHRSGP